MMNTRLLTASALTVLAAFLLWDTPLLYPLKLFVVLLHELSHGIAALLTGGSLERLRLSPYEGGLAVTRGGSRVLVLSAGYVGSALWGAGLMALSRASLPRRRSVLTILAGAIGLLALLAARDLFTLGVMLLAATGLFLLGRRAQPRWQEAILLVVGSVSCLYAVVDIGTDVLAGGPLAWLFGPRTSNDAEMLARVTWIPGFVWGLLWIAASLLIYVGTLRRLVQR